MATLENARLDALDRQFRGTDVQVIEKAYGPHRSDRSSKDERTRFPRRNFLDVPRWPSRLLAALDLIRICEWILRKPPLEIRLQLAVVERGLLGAVDTAARRSPCRCAKEDPSSSPRTSDPSTRDRGIQHWLSAKLRPTLGSRGRTPIQAGARAPGPPRQAPECNPGSWVTGSRSSA